MNEQPPDKSEIEALEKKLVIVRATMADASNLGGEIALTLYEHHAREEQRLLSEIKALSKQITFHLD